MRHLVIPDTQLRPKDDLNFLTSIGRYIVKKRPEVIVCLGDWADMESLSSYDQGKRSFEGRRYKADIEVAKRGMEMLLTPLWEYNETMRRTKHKLYTPRMVFTMGNHCNRINRAVNDDPKLDGVLSTDDLELEKYGWEVHPFLEVVVIDGIAYSHYFVSGVMGRPITTAPALLAKKHQSCIAGHQQGLQNFMGSRADGTPITAVIAGSCYEHDEDYMGPQGNKHWRGILVCHEVNNGAFDLMPVSLEYLNKKYR